MNIFPLLHTPNLKLRKIDFEDIPFLVKYADNRKISDNIINIPYPYREPDAIFRISYVLKGFKERSRFVFAIESKEINQFIGEISLHLEKDNVAQVGYWIGEPYWNKGYTKKALKAIVNFGFEQLDLNLIYAECHEDNLASQKVVLSNHFKQVSTRGKVLRFELLNIQV